MTPNPYRYRPPLTEEQRDTLLLAIAQGLYQLAAAEAKYEPIASANEARGALMDALRECGVEPVEVPRGDAQLRAHLQMSKPPAEAPMLLPPPTYADERPPQGFFISLLGALFLVLLAVALAGVFR